MTALVVYLQNTIYRLKERQEGQTMAEYALILGGIAIVVILAIVFLGGRINDLFQATGSSVDEPGLVASPSSMRRSIGLPCARPAAATRSGTDQDTNAALQEHEDLAPMMGAETGSEAVRTLRHHVAYPSGGGLAVRRRTDLRREDGVAMTEFALILPSSCCIVVGLLGFGRVFFYWIEANHLANETARWAVVDRNPYDLSDRRLQEYARSNGGTRRVHGDAKVCINFPGPAGPGSRGADPGRRSRSRSRSCRSSASGRSRSAASSTMRIERFANGDRAELLRTARTAASGAGTFGACT